MVVTVLLVLVISGHLGAGHTQQTLQTDGRPRHNLPPQAPGIHKNIFNQFHLGSTNNVLYIFHTVTESAQRKKRSVDDGGDQAVEAAIVSVQYTDKAGRLNTLRGNADKLLIKKRHRHQPGN